MPPSARVPVRLTTDTAAWRDRPAEVERTLADAASRALTRSLVPLADVEPGLPRRVLAPDIAWTGDGLDLLDPASRRDIERRLREVLLTRAREILDPGGLRSPPAAQLVAEPLDESRYDPLLGLYELPSYRKGGKKRGVKVKEKREFVIRTVLVWDQIASTPEYTKAVFRLLEAEGRTLPARHFAVLFKDRRGAIILDIYNPPSNVAEARFRLSGGSAPAKVGKRLEMRPQSLPARRSYRLSVFATESDTRGWTAVLRRYWEPAVERLIRQHKVSFTKLTIDQDIEAQLPERVKEQTEKLIAPIVQKMQGINTFLLLESEPTKLLIWTPLVMPAGLEMEVFSLLEQVERRYEVVEAKEGEDGGDGTGKEGAGEGGEAERAAAAAAARGFVFTGEPGGKGAQLYPSTGGKRKPFECKPRDGEPSIAELGADGKRLESLITEIAKDLTIQPCAYAGAFCVYAAEALGGLSAETGDFAMSDKAEAFIKPVPPGAGDLSVFEFAPTASAAVQTLRQLASVLPKISKLYAATTDVYRRRLGSEFGHWHYHFMEDVGDMMISAAANLFGQTCRVLLLQLLVSSSKSIKQRQTPGYLELFAREIQPRVERVVELVRLREELKAAPETPWGGPIDAGVLPGGTQPTEAERTDAGIPQQTVSPPTEAVSGGTPAPSPVAGFEQGGPAVVQAMPAGVVYDVSGKRVGIRDAKGVFWTLRQLEAAIEIRRGSVESLDPMVKQWTDLPEIADRLRNAASLKAEVESLLARMEKSNGSQQEEVRDDWLYAVNASRFVDTQLGILGSLQGIHSLAHGNLGPLVQFDPFYSRGVELLLRSERAKRELLALGELAGVIAISILCPPVGVAVGIGFAVYHYEEALEREELYESLLNPTEILSRAEVEAELFAARLGLALSFLPIGVELGAAARGAAGTIGRVGARAALEEAALLARDVARVGARGLGKLALARMSQHVLLEIEKGLLQTFAKEIVKAELLGKLVSAAVEPYLDQLMAELAVTGPTTVQPAATGVFELEPAE